MYEYMNPYKQNIDWIYVNNVNNVNSVNVPPNGKAWIMVQDEPIFALKTADQIGRTTTDFYKFEKTNPVKQSDYVTMEQLQQLLKEIRDESTCEQSNAEQ